MVRRHAAVFRAALMAADVASAVAIFVIVSSARMGGGWRGDWQRIGIDPALFAALYAAGWLALLWLNGLYRLRSHWSLRADVQALLRSTALLLIVTVLILFVLQLEGVSRSILIGLFAAQAGVAIASRVVIRRLFAWLRGRGHSARYMLVAGANEQAQDFADRVERHPELGLRVIGHLRAADEDGGSVNRPVLGSLDDIEDVLHEHVVDEVAICLPVAAWDLAEPVTRLCEGEGKVVRIPGDGRGPSVPGGTAEEFDGIPVQSLVYGPDRALSLAAKRGLDICLAAAGLVLLSPVMLLVGLWIRRTDGAPAFFRQQRVGLHGRRFELLKFRTMVPDAEDLLSELEEANEVSGRAFKVTDDPRLTRTGTFLRRTSLDELPQLWNVLRGEMSLVGPRPPLPREVEGYDVWHRRRLSMKPGITGLWQVSARREPEFDRWVEMDLDYIDRWSLWLDLKIIARTLPAVIAMQGR
jgi:exopolysaccharide biosynthesis polyprenyl glycosylphosphotransferase